MIYIKHKRETRTEVNLHYLTKKGFNYFITYEGYDWSIEKRIKDFSIKNNTKLEIRKNEMFLTYSEVSEEIINQKKIYGMQKFYRRQSQNILIERTDPQNGEN